MREAKKVGIGNLTQLVEYTDDIVDVSINKGELPRVVLKLEQETIERRPQVKKE